MSGVRTPAGLKAFAAISMRNSANVLKTVTAVHLRDASNVLRDLAGGGVGGMAAVASPSSVYGYGSSKGLIRISTELTTISVTGGTPPYAYSWPTGSGWGAVSPTSATTGFRSPPIGAGLDDFNLFVCTVTDALGNVVVSDTVTATCYNDGGY